VGGVDEVVEHLRVLLPFEVEAEPRRRAAAPGTAGIGRGGSCQQLRPKGDRWRETRKGMTVLQKRPPLAGYSYLPAMLPDCGSHSAPRQQILLYVESGDRV
jgi:hypothetical protein